jgi:predicted nucleotidyltransferase
MRLIRIKQQVEELTGVPVDVVTPMALPEQFRSQVLAEAKPL